MEESKPLQILPPPKNLAPPLKKDVADRIEINVEKERRVETAKEKPGKKKHAPPPLLEHLVVLTQCRAEDDARYAVQLKMRRGEERRKRRKG
jgi:hypothetical protein